MNGVVGETERMTLNIREEGLRGQITNSVYF